MNNEPSSTPEITVRHNAAEHRFEAFVAGHLSVVEYALSDEAVTFTHTLVPVELRGRGIAEKLVRAGLNWAETKHLKVVPTCSYVAVFVQRHPEFHGLLRP